MTRNHRLDSWMVSKFGRAVMPWSCSITMENLANNAKGDFENSDNQDFTYRYRRVGFSNDEAEREPRRFLHLNGPGEY